MGLDACIYAKTTDTKEPVLIDPLPDGCKIFEVDERYDLKDVVTHEIGQSWRYYSTTYERGPWPEIKQVLLALFASPNVEKVIYCSDGVDVDGAEPFTLEQVEEFSRHYEENGHEPYYAKVR
jgi:hypothetical protein